MKLSLKEIKELVTAAEIADEASHRINKMAFDAENGIEINEKELWELKNYSTQISAVLYNIHEGVYRISEVV